MCMAPDIQKEDDMRYETSPPNDILERLVLDALRHGADELDVEYKDGHEEVCAMKSNIGIGIASLESSSEEAGELRKRLYAMTKKRDTITIQGTSYHLKAEIYDSFGEDAFRVAIRR